MSQQHLCFYSTRSKYCSEFLEALAASPYVREFRFICVDAPPGGARPVLPPYVRAVPTLVIVGESEPRVDGRVMDWITDRRLREREAVAAPGLGARMGTTASVSSSGGARTTGGATDVGGPAAFSADMMGFGDEGFSFIGEDAAAEKGSTNRILGNMASLNDLHMLSIPDSRVNTSFTIMGGAGAAGEASASSSSGPKQSEKSKALDDAYTRMMAEREASTPGPKVPPNPFGSGGR